MAFNRFGRQVLIHHGYDGNVNAHHCADARRPLSGGIDHAFGLDVAMVCYDFAYFPGRRKPNIGDKHFGIDFNPHVSCLPRELEGNSAGVDVSVIRHVNGTVKAIRSQLGTPF